MIRIVLLLLFPFTQCVFAHGDLHDRIEDISEQLEEDSLNTTLLIKRANLYRLHFDYDLAIRDLGKASALSAPEEEILYLYSFVYFDMNQMDLAKQFIDDYVDLVPNSSSGRDLRIKISEKMNDFEVAIADYRFLIEHDQNAKPSYYTNLARIHSNQGSFDEAIQVLDEGEQSLGSLIVILDVGYQISTNHKEYDKATQFIEKIIGLMQRDELWLMKRYEIEVIQGQTEKSHATLKEVEKAIEILPKRHLDNPNIIALKKEVEELLSR
ncbi:MAG: hypothetical protein MRY83_23070 [Flavobacteriales bacterium]|nr:hypothetical protein [Flavobacteriales bacterium]